jgi:hypothetical protein
MECVADDLLDVTTSPESMRELAPIAADVVELLIDDPARVSLAFQRFGTGTARLGWPLDTVTRWVQMLRPRLTPQAGESLDSTAARRALVSGWANEWVRGAARTRLVDPLTGLVTPAVLARRMHEVLQRNEQESFAGSGAVPAACVAIVDLLIEDGRSLQATAALCRAAAAVAAVFHSGQTIARLGSRIVVLTVDPASVEARTDDILDAFAADPLLADLPATAWVEQIPTDRKCVERFVADLYPSDEPVRLAG